MNITSGTQTQTVLTLAEVFDTPARSGNWSRKDFAARARIERALIAHGDPFIMPGSDEAPF